MATASRGSSARSELPRQHGEFAAPFEARGTVRYVEPADVAATLGPIWDHVLRERPGMFRRSSDWWEARVVYDSPQWRGSAGPKRFAVVELDGAVAGYAMYRHAPNWEAGIDSGKIVAIEVLARSLQAERELWRYLLDMEWTSKVSARLLPLDHPLFLILAETRRMRMRVGDGLWVRLVDVGAALGARSYSAPGPVVLPGLGRRLLVERRPLEARSRRGEEDARRGGSRLRRDGARLRLPRWLHVRAARAR